MNFEMTVEQRQIRKAVLELCKRFDEHYWLDRDRTPPAALKDYAPLPLHRAQRTGAYVGHRSGTWAQSRTTVTETGI